MGFLEDKCILDLITDDILNECHPFVCGDDDMDEFFAKDALTYTHYKMGKSYCFRLKDDPQNIVACFTISMIAFVYTIYQAADVMLCGE